MNCSWTTIYKTMWRINNIYVSIKKCVNTNTCNVCNTQLLIIGTVHCQDIKGPSNIITWVSGVHLLLKCTNIKLHPSPWKSHQSFIKYLESLGMGRPGWHIVLGIKEISQILGLQLLIRAGCTETDSITISDTLDLGKTNGSGTNNDLNSMPLPTPQRTRPNFHSPSHICFLQFKISEGKKWLSASQSWEACLFIFGIHWTSEKNLFRGLVLVAAAKLWLTGRQH